MKTYQPIVLTLLFGLLCLPLLEANEELKLGGPKDRVLSADKRDRALDLAQDYLGERDEDFLEEILAAKTPFQFKQAEVAEPDETSEELEASKQAANYTDASILAVVAKSFAAQVRGQIARGSQTFLQLKGGSLIGPGSSFPVSIPSVEGKTFKLIVKTISPSGYTLQLGRASQTVRLDGEDSSASSNIQFD